MPRGRIDPAAPFQSIRATAYQTGLSQWYLRTGCRDGSIPHVRVGSDYRVNVPALLEQLNAQSTGGEKNRV